MRQHRRFVLLAVLMQALMLGATAAPVADGMNPYGDATKMNADLVDKLVDDDGQTLVEVIFQLTSPVTEQDREGLESYRMKLLGEAPLVDGGLVEGTLTDVRSLSMWERVEYLELNKELDFFYLPSEYGGMDPSHLDDGEVGIMMHETTHIVKATTSWDRIIISPEGNVEYETDLSFTEWDGDGTTIVDLDTGVDAGHPDFDYLEPWVGEKVIYSAKFDGLQWTETRNSDTSSGHGTHVGGTIAGNGDASGGRRAGVAKGGQMVALGTGDGASIFAAEQGLEWTFAHSTPGQNNHHVRVVSNSWGTDGDYDPNGVIAQLTDRLTYENGVAVIFAASNSGGSGGECAGVLKTNVYANTPSALSVAALTHDGTAVTSFSSRGCMNQQHTWPDIGAPGRDIWATAPRATAIDASTRTQGDLYYMARSGTRMATQHIGGIATLLLAAAPSLGVADYQMEDHDEGESLYFDEAAKGLQFEDWGTRNESRVHEIELILELTSHYELLRNSCEEGNDDDSCDNIPEDCYLSENTNRCHDWRVGHGLVDTDRALALARTLQVMRDPDEDGFLDNPEATVWDAYEHFEGIMDTRGLHLSTDQLRHAWKGEWSHFNNGPTSTFGTYSTDDRHYVWVPNGTYEMQIAFSSLDWDTDTAQIAQIRPNVDIGSDGNDDAQGQGTLVGDTIYIVLEIQPEHWNTWTEFDVTGTAISLPITGVLTGSEFMEPRVPYTFDVLLTLDVSEQRTFEVPLRFDGYSDLDPAPPSDFFEEDSSFDLVMVRPIYDESKIPAFNADNSPIIEKSANSILMIGVFLSAVLIIVVAATIWLRNKPDDVFEAVIEKED